ncbi:putative RNA-directed DNA polymerase from transposon BS [Folsomia candida]|uniref:Putative RNA-directed DNA polymerase from transposon BS n=1 Tax=Folsomia candida TaxID=158441 RepID=A0A226CW77_FOLCA|nr:putative RNA-directed DNA polymerase from transposon BS [Folsomia candida]
MGNKSSKSVNISTPGKGDVAVDENNHVGNGDTGKNETNNIIEGAKEQVKDLMKDIAIEAVKKGEEVMAEKEAAKPKEKENDAKAETKEVAKDETAEPTTPATKEGEEVDKKKVQKKRSIRSRLSFLSKDKKAKKEKPKPSSENGKEWKDMEHQQKSSSRYIIFTSILLAVLIKDIQKAIQELDTNKPTGIDGIPPIFYKICADSLVPILTLLFNEFLSTGEYPEELKQAAVFPLYKGKGKRCDPKCYRPISILCTTTKLFESCIYHRIMPFMEKEDKLNHQQHGYRPYRSTQSAILKLTNEIRNTGDAREISGAIFVDFSSAFDNIIHSRLLQKMESLGITGELNKWFAAYFTNRTMLVRRGKMKSAVHKLLRGTSQESTGLVPSKWDGNKH